MKNVRRNEIKNRGAKCSEDREKRNIRESRYSEKNEELNVTCEDNLHKKKRKAKNNQKRKRERKLGEKTEIDKVSVQNLKEKNSRERGTHAGYKSGENGERMIEREIEDRNCSVATVRG